MSFILDALKKSETERQEQTGAEFSNVPSRSDDAQSLKWVWILAALLGINVAVLLGILLRPNVPTPTPTTVETPSSEPAQTDMKGEPSFEEQVAKARELQIEREKTAVQQPATEVENTAVVPAPRAATSGSTSPRIRTIDEVRLSGALQITDLHLDIHVYSDVPEERFVFINMVKHREQSQLNEGPVVNEITPDGVVLVYEGTTFLLPRE
jgi:general secretion pathway protein B